MKTITQICTRCDTDMKLIPAGKSRKTGRPYSAFWTCDKRGGGCGATVSADDSETEAVAVAFPKPSASGRGKRSGAASVTGKSDSERLAAIEAKLDELIELMRG